VCPVSGIVCRVSTLSDDRTMTDTVGRVRVINASAISAHWPVGGNNAHMSDNSQPSPNLPCCLLALAADTLTYRWRHQEKRKMPTVVTKFRLSRPSLGKSSESVQCM